MVLDVVEERILAYLSIVEGRSRDVILGALALRDEDCDTALERLKERRLVSEIPGSQISLYFVTEEGRREMRR